MDTITECDGGILKDHNVLSPNYYIDMNRGQGCGTLWFSKLEHARKFKEQVGVKTMADYFDCNKCNCHYSVNDKDYNKYPNFACHKLRDEIIEAFRSKFEINLIDFI